MADIIIQDLQNTNELIQRIDQAQLPEQFLYDMLVNEEQFFKTDEVTMEIKDGSDMASAFIVPRIDGIPVKRNGYKLRKMAPVTIGGSRNLTLDDAEQRQFGEDLYTTMTPAQRKPAMALRDAFELKNMNTRRREAIIGGLITTNAINFEEIIDDSGKKGPEQELRFFDEDVSPTIVTVSNDWDRTEASGKQIMDDLYRMSQDLIERELEASVLIVSPDVAQILLQNDYFFKLLDNRRYDTIEFDTKYDKKYKSVRRLGRINAYGADLEVYSYGGSYLDPFEPEKAKRRKTYIPKGMAIVTSPNCLTAAYGRITQYEESDRDMHDYFIKDVPRVLVDVKGNQTTISEKSRPLPYPRFLHPYVCAKVVSE